VVEELSVASRRARVLTSTTSSPRTWSTTRLGCRVAALSRILAAIHPVQPRPRGPTARARPLQRLGHRLPRRTPARMPLRRLPTRASSLSFRGTRPASGRVDVWTRGEPRWPSLHLGAPAL